MGGVRARAPQGVVPGASQGSSAPRSLTHLLLLLLLLSNCLRHIRHGAWVGALRLRGRSLGSRGMPLERPPRGPKKAQKRPQEAPKRLPKGLKTVSKKLSKGIPRDPNERPRSIRPPTQARYRLCRTQSDIHVYLYLYSPNSACTRRRRPGEHPNAAPDPAAREGNGGRREREQKEARTEGK